MKNKNNAKNVSNESIEKIESKQFTFISVSVKRFSSSEKEKKTIDKWKFFALNGFGLFTKRYMIKQSNLCKSTKKMCSFA